MRLAASLSARFARSLETGRSGVVSAAVAKAWEVASAPRVARPLSFDERKRVVAVGGATLGGSGKTPLAVACAQELALAGHAVALVGHAYRARPARSRFVTTEDDVEVVGDEALSAARELSPFGVPVVVAPTRQAALNRALEQADVAVIDGVAQLRPRRAHLALLAVDGVRPWGAASCPPRGDLRAPVRALLSACDRVVSIGDEQDPVLAADLPVDRAVVRADGATVAGRLISWEALRLRRVGVWTALARPDRLLSRLERAGVTARLVVAHRDHAIPRSADLSSAAEQGWAARIDLWLASAKCATRLPLFLGGVPIATLGYRVSLGSGLVEALRRVATDRCV